MSFFEIAVLALLLLNIAAAAVIILIIRSREGTAQLQVKLDEMSGRLTESVAATQSGFAGLREETASAGRMAREEMSNRLEGFSAGLTNSVSALGKAQGERLDGFAKQLSEGRSASETQGKALREEVGQTLATLGSRLTESLEAAGKKQTEGLTSVAGSIKEMTEANERRQETLRATVEGRLDQLRTENAEKLEQMRVTVDEKLQGTLEARLGASFTQVNENLERVYKSVGEMQSLASGVGDLKRVLTNVKSRGTWGEVTLGLLLEQVMTPEQYAQNVEVRPHSGQRVEYAIKLPGDGDVPLWLPIDAKMPTEDYERLAEASERGDVAAVEEAGKGIERAVKLAAKSVHDKYICPPHTTDLGIMFLPNEGLYAEVLRRPGLVDTLQREFQVTVAGPTNLVAILSAIRMGFRTLAIQQRSGEVWTVLGKVKHEFGKFGDVLDKVQKKLGEAQNVVEAAGVRRRAVDRQLRDVEALPDASPHDVLAITTVELIEGDEPGPAGEIS
jgi:DNA recombination protein RmuC